MSWRKATRAYIERYQKQRMKPITDAPASLQLWAGRGVLDVRPRNVRLALHGCYDPSKHRKGKPE